VPTPLAKLVTEELSIPTIGIGAGPVCDGQVLVIHDMPGLYPRSSPKFVKKYINLYGDMIAAVKQYKEEVTTRTFPGPEHSFGMSEEVLKKLY
jgi:3-methyl-2-oxobutanoate hydroxymethyltransferase